MTHSVKRQGSSSKRIHVHLLRCVLWCCLLLMAVTLVLQTINLFFPAEKQVQKDELLLADALPFRLTTTNVFPFLMIPMLVLLTLFLYLKYFFAMNPLSSGGGIRYFSKHGKTVFNRQFCRWFCIGVSAISLVLTCMSYLRTHELLVLFGFLNVMSTAVLHYYASKQLRHGRRQYNGMKKRKAEKQD